MSLAHPAFLVALRWRFARKCHRRHANRAHRDHPDPLVLPANLAHLAPTATPEAQAKMAATDRPAHLVPTDHPVPLAKTERRDLPVLQPSALHRRPAILDQLVKTDLLVHLVRTAHLAQTEALAHRVTKAHPDPLALPATTALPETKDHPDRMDRRENRVFAPNIAPRTEAFSSKTEHGDKRSPEALRRVVCYNDEKPVIFMSIVAFIFFVVFNNNGPLSQLQTIVYKTAAASPVISFGAF